MYGACSRARERRPRRETMDNDNDHERRVTKRVRISLPNASGVLSAVVVLAALLTLARRSRQSLKNARSGLVVLGVAGVGIAKLLRAYGVRRVLGTDLQAEAVVATTGAPDCSRLELVRRGQAILALSHPEPEISPEAALAVGARCAADGQTLSSALAFPGRLRGALDARISRFTDAMKLAAAAGIAGGRGRSPTGTDAGRQNTCRAHTTGGALCRTMRSGWRSC